MVYSKLVSGVYIIDNDGLEVPVADWDPANNDNARFVKFTNATLMPGDEQPDNSIIISKLWESQYNTSKAWCQEYYDVPGLPSILVSGTANLDFGGKSNTDIIYNDAVTRGKDFATYYPAAAHARSVTE